MKIDSTWTSILRQIDVDLMSFCSKKYCVQKYNSGKIVSALRLKSNKFMFLAKLFETC